jgi:hypothetical protein
VSVQAPPPPPPPPEPPGPSTPPPTAADPGAGAAWGEGRAIRSPFVAVLLYTLQACLPVKRWLGVLLPCAGALLFGWLTLAVDDEPIEAFPHIAEQGLFGLIVPLTCLVIGDAVLAADLRAGTFQLTWLSPVNFATIAAGRWLGGWLVALVTLVPALMLASAIAGVGEAAVPLAVAGIAGSAAYIAVFLMLGVLVRRSTIWALAFVVLVERLLGATLTGIAQLSPLWEAQQTFAGLWGDPAHEIVRDGMPEGWSAVVRLAFITVICLAVATWRLGHMRPIGGED